MVAEAGSAGCRLSPHSPGRAGRGAHPIKPTGPGRGGVTRTHPGRPGQPRGTTPGPRCRHSCLLRKDYISQHALRETPAHAERCAARCTPGFVVLLAAAAPCRRGRLRRSARCCPSKGSSRPRTSPPWCCASPRCCPSSRWRWRSWRSCSGRRPRRPGGPPGGRRARRASAGSRPAPGTGRGEGLGGALKVF
ncbi:hypothetical protein LUU34_00193400 [Aix galericulata]|nr:hypothetical protein LUU34_00193400 [Aix galericulata]